LLLEGLREVAIADLQLLEQADVLDGDDGLVGEGRDQLDLSSAKGLGSFRARKNTPTRLPSLSIGTPRPARKPPRCWAPSALYSGSTRTSGTCAVRSSQRLFP
jgi:hypothetical protein